MYTYIYIYIYIYIASDGLYRDDGTIETTLQGYGFN